MSKTTSNCKVNWTMVAALITIVVLFGSTVALVATNQAQIETNSKDIRTLQEVNRDTSQTLRRLEINMAIMMDKMGLTPVRQSGTDKVW